MGGVFAGAIPFNDFMPASIAKTLSVLQGEKPVLIVTEGTAKLDNHKYKSLFHICLLYTSGIWRGALPRGWGCRFTT